MVSGVLITGVLYTRGKNVHKTEQLVNLVIVEEDKFSTFFDPVRSV